jgi:tetratricopeptide (TPR) repeat protein
MQDLQTLVRADLLSVDTPEPDACFIFKHLVTHEVSYENIAYTTRVQLHGMYADYLERAYPEKTDQLAPTLSYHFDLAQVSEKAAYYLTKSGEQAASSYANEEALSYFNRALKHLTGADTRAHFEILWRRERIYDLLGKRAEQRQDLAALTRLADTFEDAPDLRAQLFIRKARLEIDTGDYDAAKSHAKAVIRELEDDVSARASFPDLHVDALLAEARAMFLAGQAMQAKPQLEDALALARTHGYVRGEYNALANLGLWHWYKGDNKSAVETMEESIRLIRQAGDVRRESDILNNLGIVTKDMYRFNESLAYYEAAQRIVHKIGDRSGEASLLNNMGRASLMAGNYTEAISYCERAAMLAVEINEPAVQGLSLHNCSEALRELGQYAAARKTADESLALIRSSGYKVGEANATENLAMIEMAQGNYPDALGHAEGALAITREVSARRVEASVLIRIGLIRLGMKQYDEAEKNLLEAKKLEEELNEPVYRFEIEAGLAESALGRGEAGLSFIQNLLNELMQEPPTEQSHYLPLGLYLSCVRVLQAAGDPRADRLAARASNELNTRSQRITDAALQASYLNVREHRAIAELRNL